MERFSLDLENSISLGGINKVVFFFFFLYIFFNHAPQMTINFVYGHIIAFLHVLHQAKISFHKRLEKCKVHVMDCGY